jgi:hypothetical protein
MSGVGAVLKSPCDELAVRLLRQEERARWRERMRLHTNFLRDNPDHVVPGSPGGRFASKMSVSHVARATYYQPLSSSIVRQ